MKEIAVYEAKTRLSELLAEVESGEQVVITRRGVAVAKLVAAGPTRRPAAASQRQRVAAVFADLRAGRKGVTLDIPVREAIEQGRD
ncbi:MAG TPA: type II toxin-antitoxin system prevent-host-death family antitoxin [Quisquiliibacterium sp.]|nr:type II toxin-antitoxin system prevent-host-death family antitoxin [Quisquiliibacterium sp.]